MRVFKKKALLSNHQPWINKRKRKRSSRHDRSQTKHIPIDLALDILSRLPAESVVRFGCVSRLWSSLTKLPSFINSFASRSSSRRPRLLVTFSVDSKQYGIWFPQHQNPDHGSYPPFYTFHITEPYFLRSCAISKSVEGLILISGLDGLVIWNPTLRRFSTLPRPNVGTINKQKFYISYLGYDPLECKHKVLSTEYDEYSEEVRELKNHGE
ncbi:putative F-box protein [Raphanus sativus]|nr:putative F-box protein [Raphanus sativus]